MRPSFTGSIDLYIPAHKTFVVSVFIPQCVIPGDWNGTPYQPLYDYGAKGDWDWARQFLGLLVKERVLDWVAATGERWGTKKYNMPGHEFDPRCYFILR
jgi:hypothetical protein